MKVEELRKLTKTDLVDRCNQLVTELNKVTVAIKSGDLTPENINKSRSLKLEVARIKTVINELKLLG